MSRSLTVLAVAALSALSASPARADDACSLEPVRPRAAALLGRDPFTTLDIRLDADGTRGRVELVNADGVALGTRTIAAATCGELVEAMALVIAMAARTVAVVEAPVAIEPAPAIATAAADPSSANLAYDVIAGAAAGGSTQGFTETVSLGARAHAGDESLELAARVQLPDDVAVGPGPGIVRVYAATLAATPCWQPGGFALCATAIAGWEAARGEHLEDAGRADLAFAALGGRVGWERAVSPRLAIRLALEVDAPVLSGHFDVGSMSVWSSGAVEAWMGAAAVLRIP